MTYLNTALIIGILAASSLGAAAFKQFTLTKEFFWLATGWVAYNASNFAWIMLIDDQGLARAMVFSAAGQIILTTILGALFGERLGPSHLVAAILACAAVFAASSGDFQSSAIHSDHQPTQEDTDA